MIPVAKRSRMPAVAANGVRFERLHADDLPAQRAQVVDVVDQVEEDRPGAFLPAPRWLEIIVGLVEPEGRLDRQDGAEPARFDDLPRLLHHGVVAAVVADEQGHARRLGRLDQARRRGDIVGDRFLHQSRHARRHRREAVLDMHLVRRGDDHAIRPARRDHLGEGREPRDAVPARQLLADGRGIDHGDKIGLRPRHHVLDMALADEAGAEHRELDRIHGPVRAKVAARRLTSWPSPRP